MTVYDLLKKHYPDYLFKLKKVYPDFFSQLKKIPVFPWKDEYNIADKNPEIIETIRKLDKLLEETKISKEEYQKAVSELPRTFASRTEGISFIQAGFVSFRDKIPSIHVILHEAGHIYFKETDLFWNATYGGGEILFFLGLKDKYRVTEENIFHYMSLLKQCYEDPEEVYQFVLEKLLTTGFDCAKSVYAYMVYSGTIPDINVIIAETSLSEEEKEKIRKKFNFLIIDPQNPEWEKIPITRHGMLSFFINLISGLQWNDPFYSFYAKKLGIIS